MSKSDESNVPRIRFKEFFGEWVENPVSHFILSLDAGVSVKSGDRRANKSEFGVLKTSAVTNGVFEADENKVVLEGDEQSRLKEPVCGGTIIISRMNTPALVGANAYVESSHENLFLPDRLWAAKPREGASMRFLAVILGSDKGRASLSAMAKGTSGSMKNITKPDVLSSTVKAPTPAEQTQIGEYFGELNRLIGLHQHKHDKLVTLKKAMLLKMFAQPGATIPEIRFKGFSGDWVEKKLSHFLEVSTEKNLEGVFSKDDVLSVSGDVGVVNQIEFQGRSFAGKSVENYGVVRHGWIVYTKSPLKASPFGIIKANQGAPGIVSVLYAIYRPKLNADPVFIQNYFALEWRLNSYLQPLVNKGAKNAIMVNDENALLGLVTFPGKEEQQKIGRYFRTLDELISKHAVQLQKLKQVKAACLEKMFV
jgi:hypothetical protein